MTSNFIYYLGQTLEKYILFLSTSELWDGISYLDFIVVTAIISMVLTTLLYKGRT